MDTGCTIDFQNFRIQPSIVSGFALQHRPEYATGRYGLAVASNTLSFGSLLATFPTLNVSSLISGSQGGSLLMTLKLNLVYEKQGNIFYDQSDKADIAGTYVNQAKVGFGHIDINFAITETDGAGEDIFNSNRRITTGYIPGSINALFTKRGDPGTFGFTSSPEVTNANTGSIFIGTVGNGRDPKNLAHGIIHALGIANGLNGYSLSSAENETIRVEQALFAGRPDYRKEAADNIFYKLRLWAVKYEFAGPRPH